MRGHDIPQTSLFSFVDMEKRIPTQHPLRKIRILVDRGLVTLEPRLSAMYSDVGRVSIAPEKLIRALLIQIPFSVRSERQLVERERSARPPYPADLPGDAWRFLNPATRGSPGFVKARIRAAVQVEHHALGRRFART